MENMESAYNTLRNAEIDHKKNQIADPEVAEEMANVEHDARTKKVGLFGSREDKIRKGLKESVGKGAEILAKRAEEMMSNLKIIDIQKREKEVYGTLISFEYDGHIYEFDKMNILQDGDEEKSDYFELVSVDGDDDFTDEEEKRLCKNLKQHLE